MMKSGSYWIFSLLFILAVKSDARAQSFLFKQPRKGGFKFVKNDHFDFTSTQHFTGSGVIAVGFHKLLKNTRVKYPKLLAAFLASGVGLLKEYEDGYREGWGIKDTISNQLGIITFLFLSDITHYTLTFKQVITSPEDYGIGIRFFKTSDFTPLNASLGIYTVYTSRREGWVGVDSHFVLVEGAECHIGLSMVKLQDANQFNLRPNFGVAFRLF